ncbi:Glutathione S-transferase [Enhydrobacter aerosaccus]|uniref:Glutathione S-transferase n=1 Tax=Enhydrobacter aerosaccus TaxID=225324 RepID=A0A1T4SUF6_9HYPH|nr:glutathione S-transferase family protein [Enhydrobacter aerosaccus]SKA31905.1 Glutathione S-transferase [Enhydrobacter aerosaccus]
MPSTITLYGFGPGFGLPEVSPFVTKTEVQLKMAGLPYIKERSRPDASPKGQLPFIADDGARIADSTFIRTHIETKYGIDLDAGLDARQRAEAWMLERMIENHLHTAMIYARWLVPENFAKGPGALLIPPAAHEEVLARVTAALKAQGMARHAPDETAELGDRSLQALSFWLDDKPYLMGDRPSGVDATAFAEVAGILTPFFDSSLRRKAQRYDNLVGYTARLMKRYYPEHPW